MLESRFTAEEIYTTIFQLGPIKALEKDGFVAIFNQKFWSIVG